MIIDNINNYTNVVFTLNIIYKISHDYIFFNSLFNTMYWIS